MWQDTVLARQKHWWTALERQQENEKRASVRGDIPEDSQLQFEDGVEGMTLDAIDSWRNLAWQDDSNGSHSTST